MLGFPHFVQLRFAPSCLLIFAVGKFDDVAKVVTHDATLLEKLVLVCKTKSDEKQAF